MHLLRIGSLEYFIKECDHSTNNTLILSNRTNTINNMLTTEYHCSFNELEQNNNVKNSTQ